MLTSSPLESVDEGVLVSIRVSPDSERFEVGEVDIWRGELKIFLSSPAKRGEANKELLNRLRSLFNADVELVSGFTSRRKNVLVRGVSVESISNVLDIDTPKSS